MFGGYSVPETKEW